MYACVAIVTHAVSPALIPLLVLLRGAPPQVNDSYVFCDSLIVAPVTAPQDNTSQVCHVF